MNTTELEAKIWKTKRGFEVMVGVNWFGAFKDEKKAKARLESVKKWDVPRLRAEAEARKREEG